MGINNMNYGEAINAVKLNGTLMRVFKKLRKNAKTAQNQQVSQRHIIRVKREINLLLSIIHAHKTARKLYNENRKLRNEIKQLKINMEAF